MPNGVLSLLSDAMTPRLAARGYVLVDQVEHGGMGWLEYEGGTVFALSVTYRAELGTVRAELWRPGDLGCRSRASYRSAAHLALCPRHAR